MLIAGCSSSKNTASTRWWKAFNAHYNTYYNGTLAYIDGSLEKENGNKDNYTELIPLYTVGNKNSRELGKSNYDRAIEKCQKAIQRYSIKRRPEWDKNRKKTERDIEWLQRREYNPFLWKAWMLMGRSQFYEGDFDGAASTFSYMSRLYATQPAIYSRAQAWPRPTLRVGGSTMPKKSSAMPVATPYPVWLARNGTIPWPTSISTHSTMPRRFHI